MDRKRPTPRTVAGTKRLDAMTDAARAKLRDRAVELRWEGNKVAAVAQAIGCSMYLTRTLLKEANRPYPSRVVIGQRAKLQAEAKVRFNAGESLAGIAAVLGVSTGTVQRLLHEAGVSRPRRNIPALNDPTSRQALRADAVARHEAGASLRKVAAAGGYSHTTAKRLLVEAEKTRPCRDSRPGEQPQAQAPHPRRDDPAFSAKES